MPKRYRQLQLKDLPKVPMWRLEQEPTTLLSTLPMRHHAPHPLAGAGINEIVCAGQGEGTGWEGMINEEHEKECCLHKSSI